MEGVRLKGTGAEQSATTKETLFQGPQWDPRFLYVLVSLLSAKNPVVKHVSSSVLVSIEDDTCYWYTLVC